MWPLRHALLVFLVVAVCACGDSAPSADATASPGTSAPTGPTPSPAAGETRAVTFDAGGMQLAGDLRVPDGPGPHPGVVLVGGSGPVGRDGVVPGQLAMGFPTPVTVLADLADGLQAAGYAVLTYDKRTCGPFNGCAENGYPPPADDLTIDVFASDAMAAVAHLRSQPDVAGDAVAVAGHSQGATLVPGLLLDDPELAAGVLLSAPFEPVDRTLARQADTVERIVAGMTPAPPGVDAEIARLRRLADRVGDLRGGGTGDGADIGGASAGFWRSWLRVSDGVPALAAQAPQPVLVLTGAADTNVGAEQTAQWRDTLTGADDRVVAPGCVSHALNCLGTDDPLEVDPAAIDDHVDPAVIDAVAGFLDDVMR